MQTVHYDWAGDGNGYDFVLRIPDPFYDAGDFTQLQILKDGRKVFELLDEGGLVKYETELGDAMTAHAKHNLLSSPYLLMLNSPYGKASPPLLFLFGYAYASSPGSVRIIALDKQLIPREIFYQRNFWITALTDLDNDSRFELIGGECFSQKWGPDYSLMTYDPFTVYRFGDQATSAISRDLQLSEQYNKEHYYGWAGPECSERTAVVLDPPGGGDPILMDADKAQLLFEKRGSANE